MIEPHADQFRRAVEPALARALADELEELTEQMNSLACDLGSDAETLRRHMASLQAIDRIVQTQLAVADILRAGSPTALADVPLESVSDRLQFKYKEYVGRT